MLHSEWTVEAEKTGTDGKLWQLVSMPVRNGRRWGIHQPERGYLDTWGAAHKKCRAAFEVR